MKMTFKILASIALFSIASCSSTMKKEHFENKEERITAIGVNFTYNGKKENLGKIGTCFVTFEDQNNKILKFRRKNNYFFFTNDNIEEINLSLIQCQNYRVFYNKCRLKRVSNDKQTIFKKSSDTNKQIVYAGSVDADWTPEIFKISDLFYMGHLGIQDNGPFSIRDRDDYEGFLKFIKKEFDKDSNEISNGSNHK